MLLRQIAQSRVFLTRQARSTERRPNGIKGWQIDCWQIDCRRSDCGQPRLRRGARATTDSCRGVPLGQHRDKPPHHLITEGLHVAASDDRTRGSTGHLGEQAVVREPEITQEPAVPQSSTREPIAIQPQRGVELLQQSDQRIPLFANGRRDRRIQLRHLLRLRPGCPDHDALVATEPKRLDQANPDVRELQPLEVTTQRSGDLGTDQQHTVAAGWLELGLWDRAGQCRRIAGHERMRGEHPSKQDRLVTIDDQHKARCASGIARQTIRHSGIGPDRAKACVHDPEAALEQIRTLAHEVPQTVPIQRMGRTTDHRCPPEAGTNAKDNRASDDLRRARFSQLGDRDTHTHFSAWGTDICAR
ncbi:MAG: hypothetical protein IPK26_21420 [Planctomycetes bacterium]|nr:hypothetical protein [Planctomycetota bacterium]